VHVPARGAFFVKGAADMKKIEAVVRSEKVADVRKALEKTNFSGLMLTQVDGHGKQKGTMQEWRGDIYRVGILPKTKIEIVADDADVVAIVNAIIDSARTGEIGDGKIFVSPVEEVYRIRTGEKGVSAV
jgi:nitrogen regulatory protein P-II 1